MLGISAFAETSLASIGSQQTSNWVNIDDAQIPNWTIIIAQG